MIDTLKLARRLKEAGMPTEQAEGLALALDDCLKEYYIAASVRDARNRTDETQRRTPRFDLNQYEPWQIIATAMTIGISVVAMVVATAVIVAKLIPR